MLNGLPPPIPAEALVPSGGCCEMRSLVGSSDEKQEVKGHHNEISLTLKDTGVITQPLTVSHLRPQEAVCRPARGPLTRATHQHSDLRPMRKRISAVMSMGFCHSRLS